VVIVRLEKPEGLVEEMAVRKKNFCREDHEEEGVWFGDFNPLCNGFDTWSGLCFTHIFRSNPFKK